MNAHTHLHTSLLISYPTRMMLRSMSSPPFDNGVEYLLGRWSGRSGIYTADHAGRDALLRQTSGRNPLPALTLAQQSHSQSFHQRPTVSHRHPTQCEAAKDGGRTAVLSRWLSSKRAAFVIPHRTNHLILGSSSLLKEASILDSQEAKSLATQETHHSLQSWTQEHHQ